MIEKFHCRASWEISNHVIMGHRWFQVPTTHGSDLVKKDFLLVSTDVKVLIFYSIILSYFSHLLLSERAPLIN